MVILLSPVMIRSGEIAAVVVAVADIPGVVSGEGVTVSVTVSST